MPDSFDNWSISNTDSRLVHIKEIESLLSKHAVDCDLSTVCQIRNFVDSFSFISRQFKIINFSCVYFLFGTRKRTNLTVAINDALMFGTLIDDSWLTFVFDVLTKKHTGPRNVTEHALLNISFDLN